MKKAYVESDKIDVAADPVVRYMSSAALEKTIEKIKKSMKKAARELDFIEAARYRDEIYELEKLLKLKTKGTDPARGRLSLY